MRKIPLFLILVGGISHAQIKGIEVSCPNSKNLLSSSKPIVKCSITNETGSPIKLSTATATGCELDRQLSYLEPIQNNISVNIYLNCDFGNQEYVSKDITMSFSGIGVSKQAFIVGSITGNVIKDCKK